MGKKEFIVKEENGVVIATMSREDENCEWIIDEVMKKCSKPVKIAVGGLIYRQECLDYPIDICPGDAFRGVARCVEDDVFNERVGKEIAASICDMKYHNVMSKKYSIIIRILEKAIKELAGIKAVHDKKVSNIKEDMRRCYGDKRIE